MMKRCTSSLPELVVVVVCLLLQVVIDSTTAFTTPKTYPSAAVVAKSSSLFYRSFPHDGDDENSKSSSMANSDKAQIERVSSIAGVSVSSDGFQVVLETATSRKFITLPVTSSSEDEFATTTPESLTIIQLINGVDMAGTMLPPDILARMVILHCEEEAQDEHDAWLEQLVDEDHGDDDHDEDEPFETNLSKVQQGVLSFIQTSLCDFQSSSQYSSSSSSSSKTLSSYTDSHSWVQNKLKLPTTTLDQLKVMIEVVEDEDTGRTTSVRITDVRLECAVYGVGAISFSPSELVTSQVLYTYHPSNEGQISKSFLSIALALRYKAPIVLEYSYTTASSGGNEKKPKEEDHSAISAYSAATPSSSNTNNSRNEVDDSSYHNVYLWDSLDDMSRTYPKWTTVQNLQSSSTRVTQNIERGFEIQKLSGALRIAMERGDQKAVDAIREKLDEYDSMNDLPTTADTNSCKGSGDAVNNVADPELSYYSSVDGNDEDKNILQ